MERIEKGELEMEKTACWSLYAWGNSGERYLNMEKKKELQEYILDELVEEHGKSEFEDEAWIMDFGYTYPWEADRIYGAIEIYASLHPDILLEIEYINDTEGQQEKTRYLGNEKEKREQIRYYRPFTKLKGKDDQKLSCEYSI